MGSFKRSNAFQLLWGICLFIQLILSVFTEAGAQIGSTGVHDPCIIKCEDYYYIFCTSNLLAMRQSQDINYWRNAGNVFNSLPAWGVAEVPGVSNIWAPDIFYYKGKYHLYYSLSTFGSNRSRIGLVTNKTLDPFSDDYEWVDQGKAFESNTSNNYNAIDPNMIEDADGNVWMAFGSFWTGIKLVEVDTSTMKPRTGAPLHSIAARPGNTAIEAPFIIYKNGYYYLFVSFDACCQGVNSTYNIRFGRSDKITGYYRDQDNKIMVTGGGTLLLSGDTRWKGPGHCAVLMEGDSTWLVYHAYDAQNNGRATLRIQQLYFDEEHWPTLDPAAAAVESATPKNTPHDFELLRNYPNPFNGATSIRFFVTKQAYVSLKIYDQLGRKIATLVNRELSAGEHRFSWQPTNLPSGVYFCRLTVDDRLQTRKVLFLK